MIAKEKEKQRNWLLKGRHFLWQWKYPGKYLLAYLRATKLQKEVTESGIVLCWGLWFLSFYVLDCYQINKWW